MKQWQPLKIWQVINNTRSLTMLSRLLMLLPSVSHLLWSCIHSLFMHARCSRQEVDAQSPPTHKHTHTHTPSHSNFFSFSFWFWFFFFFHHLYHHYIILDQRVRVYRNVTTLGDRTSLERICTGMHLNNNRYVHTRTRTRTRASTHQDIFTIACTHPKKKMLKKIQQQSNR